LHGFARTSDWTLTDAAEQGNELVLAFTLVDTAETRASVWPHRFRARYTVSVGASLRLALDVTNTGDARFTAQEAFHTYLEVGDVRTAQITGLKNAPYIDRLSSPEVLPPDGDALQITGETDRIYAQPGTIVVVDPTKERSLQVAAAGSANAVVWNPWNVKAAAMADFGDDEWQRMVCVETCNVLDAAITLDPGDSHTMAATITVAR
jgi:D-hexose-6-phosphate mutarotase